MPNPRTNPIPILSLGAGVQSSTIALMAAEGLISAMPLEAVFADTHSEPEETYRYLAWLRSVLPFPVVTVSAGSLYEKAALLDTTKKLARKIATRVLPSFYVSNGAIQMSQRRCTSSYKIIPIRQHVRKYFRAGVQQWIGISTDEAGRMKDSQVSYIKNRYPLIELEMSRQDCIDWLDSKGYPVPPKSSCVFCPFHDDKAWSNLKLNHPADFERAVELERHMQANELVHDYASHTPYLHRSCKPLDQIQFRHEKQPDLFQNECFGMCGN